jgi:hypothetical protein
MPEWVFSWVIAALAIYPLILVERWIHRHIQGLGLLLTNNEQAAVLMYYIALFPGVLIHETSQWLLAKVLRVKVLKFQLWPEERKTGLIRLGLVDIDRRTDMFRATLIGIIPLVTGLVFIIWIASTHFDTAVLLESVVTGDLTIIWAGFKIFTSAPDFWLWFFLTFTIANAMLPEAHDEINWWLILGVVAGVFVVLLLLDLSIIIQFWLDGPLAQVAEWLALALVTALVIDLLVMGIIAATEEIASRILDREVEYDF